MNNKKLTAASSLSTCSYISPVAKITEIHSEGVLCMSWKLINNNTIEEWDVIEKPLEW